MSKTSKWMRFCLNFWTGYLELFVSFCWFCLVTVFNRTESRPRSRNKCNMCGLLTAALRQSRGLWDGPVASLPGKETHRRPDLLLNSCEFRCASAKQTALMTELSAGECGIKGNVYATELTFTTLYFAHYSTILLKTHSKTSSLHECFQEPWKESLHFTRSRCQDAPVRSRLIHPASSYPNVSGLETHHTSHLLTLHITIYTRSWEKMSQTPNLHR